MLIQQQNKKLVNNYSLDAGKMNQSVTTIPAGEVKKFFPN